MRGERVGREVAYSCGDVIAVVESHVRDQERGNALDRASAALYESTELLGTDVGLKRQGFGDDRLYPVAIGERQIEPFQKHRLHDWRRAWLALLIVVEDGEDTASTRLCLACVKQVLRLVPAPAMPVHLTLVIDCWRREDDAPLGVHSCAAGSPHEVVEIAHHDLLATLAGRSDNQIL